jgi:hypothetical protein
MNGATNNNITHKQPFGKCCRCSGQTYVTSDEWGRFECCLQCGFTKDLDQPILLKTNKQTY